MGHDSAGAFGSQPKFFYDLTVAMSSEEPFANTFHPLSARGSGSDTGAELRTDPLNGQDVIMAPARSLRPNSEKHGQRLRVGPEHVAECPLCPGNEYQTPPPTLTLTRPGSSEPWSLRVVPNLYPIVSSGRAKARAGRIRPATGVHELVVETPSHSEELPDRDAGQVVLLLEAIRRRMSELEARAATRHVIAFKNKGLEAGASLEHPHSQIIALNFVPGDVRQRVRFARRHLKIHGGCPLCAVVELERKDGGRIVFERDQFVAFAPYASSSAGEVLLVPLTHSPSFTTVSSEDCERLAASLIDLLRRARDAFNDPPYNLMLHTAPKRWREDEALHWYWRLTPRLTRQAGLELATGLNINSMLPEDVAELLRAGETAATGSA
jgi:UDPglucose--hexose-1-phosphate uridylyltransferase